MEYNTEIVEQASPIVTFIVTWLLPIIIMYALFSLLMRSMTKRMGGGIGGIGFDQVNDRFRLGQIQLAVQEGSLGKFPPLGRLCSGKVQRLQPGGQHGGGAVAVEFHRVLPGVAVGPPGDHRHALVEAAALLIVEGAQIQAAIRSLQQ